MTKMNPEIKARWVAALRSGKYEQGSGELRGTDNRFCCLGVLCNLHAESHPAIAEKQTKQHEYMGSLFLPPEEVCEWAGLDVDTPVCINGVHDPLYYHNDKGRTFSEIADAIEAQL